MKLILLLLITLSSTSLYAVDCLTLKKVSSFYPSYAEGFSIDYYRDFKIVHSNFNQDKFIIANKALTCKTPLFVFQSNPKRVAATSTTHLFILKEFNLIDRLKAFQGVKYLGEKTVGDLKIKDLNLKLDREELILLAPDLVIAYSGNFNNDHMINEYRKLKLPVALNYDFVEKHPLGRLEWMIFTAAFFDLDEKAKSLFVDKSKKYEAIKKTFLNQKKKKVLVGDINEGKWVTPGSLSNLGVLIRDAGGELVLNYKSDKTQFLSIEEVIHSFSKSDLWLTHNFWQDKKTIINDSIYKTFKDLRVYNNNKKTNKLGFNDFWEDAQNYPEKLLVELNKVMNHDLTNLTWYQELK